MIKGKKIVHCHGKDRGKTLMTLPSHKKAVQVHRAIMANKSKKRKKKKRGRTLMA